MCKKEDIYIRMRVYYYDYWKQKKKQKNIKPSSFLVKDFGESIENKAVVVVKSDI